MVFFPKSICFETVKKCSKIRQIPLAPLFGEAIDRINHEKSVSILFD